MGGVDVEKGRERETREGRKTMLHWQLSQAMSATKARGAAPDDARQSVA
jgi:hypothetical protein